MTAPRTEFDDALALLARGLAGAIEVGAHEHLPRPEFPVSAAAAAAATTTTTAAAPPAPPPTSAANAASAPIVAPVPKPAPSPTTTTTTTTTTKSPTPTTPPPTRPAPPAPPPAYIVGDGLVGAELRAALAGLVADWRPAPDRLKVLNDDVIGACTRCKLSRGRNELVFGVGNPAARLVFVGEGPGEAEDRSGEPFVGAAGQLLTKMIGAMGFKRDEVYICNVVKCRPPNNRDPEVDEVDACEGFLKTQLGIIKPQVVVGLGKTAVHTLLRTTTPISKLRGTWQSYEGIPFMPTYHPAYLLREERDPDKKRKREAWSDLQLVMERLKR
ncbi:MAG TPA: uracil-DNA glycosylase [Myxococcota bacterium]